MRSRSLIIATLAWLCVAATPAAAQTRLDSVTIPKDPAFEAKVREVASSLRCPVCQNNSIEESPSLLARDMKREVRQRLAAGESPDEIRRYYVSRYGEWVLTKPRAAGANLSVWLLPVVALLGGAVVVWRSVGRWVRQGTAAGLAATGEGATTARVGAGTPDPREAAELRTRKAALLASLAELEAEFAAGRLTASDRALLKQRDEAELAAVSDALKQLKKTHAAGTDKREAPAAEAGVPSARRFAPALGWSAGIAAFALVVVLSLKGAVISRPAGGTISGVQLGGAATSDTFELQQQASALDSLQLTQLEARVRRDSSDQTALIELGHLYLVQGRLKRSADLGMKAVELQPDAEGTAEAYAHLGMILWSTGEIDAALKSLDKALYLHPDFPEALLYRGIILFAGVRDMGRATEALQRYLDVAPGDANTERVKGMLEAARQASRP